jgi:arylsulfatase A-like enzyme
MSEGILLPRLAEVSMLSHPMSRIHATSGPVALAALAALAAFATTAGCGESGPVPLDGPNIVVFSIDSLRHDHLGCYGYPAPTSPTIDRLAASGVRFETAVSTTSWTLPSHAALFTGMFDTAHGLVDNGLALADQHRTLAEELKAGGYRTAGFYGGPYLHPTFGLGQGFDHYQSCMTTLQDDLTGEQVRMASRAPIGASHEDVTGPRTVAEVTRWLDGQRGAQGPFFLFVHLWDVHYDYIPPPEYAAIFVDPRYRGEVDGREFAKIVRERRPLKRADRQHLIDLYDAEIRFTDHVIEQILATLEERGHGEDTLVVITADHGEEFFEHGGWGHQSSLFDEQVRIPLIFHWPGRLGPRVVSDQVRLIDLMPTLLSLAGARRLPNSQGRSLAPLMLGESLPPEPALLELLVDRRQVRALREGGWKYLEPGDPTQQGGFDLTADPAEQVLHQAPPNVREGILRLRSEVKSALEFRIKKVGRGTQAIEYSDEMLKALEGLGYTE